MSVRAFSDVRLILSVVLGPVIALVNQQAIYSGATWACGYDARGTLHIIPILALVAVILLGLDAYSLWRSANRREGTIATRTTFLAVVGIALSTFSAVVIAAQWIAIFTLDACMK